MSIRALKSIVGELSKLTVRDPKRVEDAMAEIEALEAAALALVDRASTEALRESGAAGAADVIETIAREAKS